MAVAQEEEKPDQHMALISCGGNPMNILELLKQGNKQLMAQMLSDLIKGD